MSVTLEVLHPVAASQLSTRPLAPRLESLNGKTIGLFWNDKPNGDVLLRHLGDQIRQRVPGAQVKLLHSRIGSPKEVLDEAVATCDAVVGAPAD